MSDFGKNGRPVAILALMALGACAMTLLVGVAASLEYAQDAPTLRKIGLTLQHLRPMHESFAFAWVFLGGVATVHGWLLCTGGALTSPERLRFAAMTGCWTAAGVGIFTSLSLGHFTGREYAGYHPFFGALIVAGWLLFAWNFFGRAGFSLRGKPAYIYMWTAAIPLFLITFCEANAYTLDWISRRPLRDIAVQWKANGVMVGAFNLLAYGSLMWVGGRMRGDDSYAYSPTAFVLFFVGILNTFTNYGHHTFHLPQTPWIHWISFLVSMLEVVILGKVLWDLWRLRRKRPAPPDLAVPDRFASSVTFWTAAMLYMAMLLSIPPLNTAIHGTHVVTAHAMGTMIGIDSMILWMALSWALRQVAGPTHPAVRSRAMRAHVLVLDVCLLGFLATFVLRGLAAGLPRSMGPNAPDLSRAVAAFPVLMLVFGSVLALAALHMIVRWMLAFAGSLRGRPAVATFAPDAAQRVAG